MKNNDGFVENLITGSEVEKEHVKQSLNNNNLSSQFVIKLLFL